MTGPNDLITALRQKRQEGENTSSTKPGVEIKPAQSVEERLSAMDQKIDRILECVESGPDYKEGESNGTGNIDPGKY